MEKFLSSGLFTRLGLVSQFLPLYGYADQCQTLMNRLCKVTRSIWIKYESVFIEKLLTCSRRPLPNLLGEFNILSIVNNDDLLNFFTIPIITDISVNEQTVLDLSNIKSKEKVYFESLTLYCKENFDILNGLVKQLSQMKGNIKIVICSESSIYYEVIISESAKISKDTLTSDLTILDYKISKILIDFWKSPFTQTEFMSKAIKDFIPSECSFAVK